MTWADVPAKIATWQAATYYQTNPDGLTSMLTQFGGSGTTVGSINTVPPPRRADFEALLDHYNGAVSNLAVSSAIDPKLLRG